MRGEIARIERDHDRHALHDLIQLPGPFCDGSIENALPVPAEALHAAAIGHARAVQIRHDLDRLPDAHVANLPFLKFASIHSWLSCTIDISGTRQPDLLADLHRTLPDRASTGATIVVRFRFRYASLNCAAACTTAGLVDGQPGAERTRRDACAAARSSPAHRRPPARTREFLGRDDLPARAARP